MKDHRFILWYDPSPVESGLFKSNQAFIHKEEITIIYLFRSIDRCSYIELQLLTYILPFAFLPVPTQSLSYFVIAGYRGVWDVRRTSGACCEDIRITGTKKVVEKKVWISVLER